MNLGFTNNEIEDLADGMIRQFQKNDPDSLQVNVEGFITQCLKLPIRYHAFAEEDLDKIGFISDGITPLKIREHGEVIQCVFPKGTIVIEKCLLTPAETGRRRFTLAHEASHFIMDRSVSAASFHREYDQERAYTPLELKELLSFSESRVDRLGAALLMPRYMVRHILHDHFAVKKIPVYGNTVVRLEDKLLLKKITSAMGVSYTAFFIRLRELGLLEYREIGEYLSQEMGMESGVYAP